MGMRSRRTRRTMISSSRRLMGRGYGRDSCMPESALEGNANRLSLVHVEDKRCDGRNINDFSQPVNIQPLG
jgi:hypothetical protein